MNDLDDVGSHVLRVLALFDPDPVPEFLMKNLHEEFAMDPFLYREIVREGLVNNGSLLEEHEDETGFLYQMHRLVREFVLVDTKIDTNSFA